MKENISKNVCTLNLSEEEWYGQSKAQQDALREQCKQSALKNKCDYAAIMVTPSAVLSVSPRNVPHVVWTYTFPSEAEMVFENALREAYAQSGLSAQRMKVIAKRVFGI